MICEFTNILIGITYRIMEVTWKVPKSHRLEYVSILDVIAWTFSAIVMIIMVSWWWIPAVLIFNRDWRGTTGFFSRNRFRCKRCIE